MVQHIQDSCIDTQADNRYYDKLAVLGSDIGIIAGKGPVPVQKIIAGSCYNKSQPAGHITLRTEKLLRHVGSAEIDDHPQHAYQAKPEYLKKEFAYLESNHGAKVINGR